MSLIYSLVEVQTLKQQLNLFSSDVFEVERDAAVPLIMRTVLF